MTTSAPPPEGAEPGTRLTPWGAWILRRATRADLLYCIAVLGLAALTLWSGNAAARHLSPEGAANVSSLLDDLELPGALPNAPLLRDDGQEARFFDLTKGRRTIVAFYAPWCGPCQEELPILVRGTADEPERLAVIVGPDEEPADVRKQLDNLGFKDLRYHTDVKRQLEVGGRVTALPTTFLVGRLGRVHERIVGYSGFRLYALILKATTAHGPSIDDVN